jgi:hypothetical protein
VRGWNLIDDPLQSPAISSLTALLGDMNASTPV